MDFSLLTKLTETPGISGREERVREVVAEKLSGVASETRVDAMGSLIAHVPGKGPRVALVAHMDEVGFMVSKIEKEGLCSRHARRGRGSAGFLRPENDRAW